MQRYGLDVAQLSPHGQAAVQAAERLGSRTIIYRDKVPVAAVVPIADLEKMDPADPVEQDGVDPLLSLCGNFASDYFVDGTAELERTNLYLRVAPPPTQKWRSDDLPNTARVISSPPGYAEIPPRTGATLKPPDPRKP